MNGSNFPPFWPPRKAIVMQMSTAEQGAVAVTTPPTGALHCPKAELQCVCVFERVCVGVHASS